MPRVTAIITTFNRAHFLRASIRSVLSQTYRDLELLVLDNSSSDDTTRVVESFSDPRLHYIRHAPLNISRSRSLGLNKANGEFVAFLDDDDEWLPPKIQRQVGAFDAGDSSLGLVYGGFVRIDSEGTEFETHLPILRGKILSDLLWQKDAFTGSASNPMMKLSGVMEIGGFDEKLMTSEDWEMYLRLSEKYQIDYVPDVVVRIRSHRGPRLGDRVGDAMKVEEMVLYRYAVTMSPELRSYYLQKIGGKLCRIGSPREGRQRLRDALWENPSNWIAGVQYLLSLTGMKNYQRIHRLYKRFV